MDDDQFIREAAEHFTRPWPQRRGIESIDRNAAVVLLKRGDRYRVQNPGFCLVLGYDADGRSQEIISVPDLVRVDYFRFGK
jgi:hypothetical protein